MEGDNNAEEQKTIMQILTAHNTAAPVLPPLPTP